MGPKAAPSTNAIVSVGPASVSRLSLVTDCNLDETENFYLKWAHMNWTRYETADPHETAIQHIWQAYGSIFEDKSLHYATLCVSYKAFHFSERQTGPQELYYRFQSRFLASLRDAVTRHAVSEVHLFAVFLILYDETSEPDETSFITHFRGFLSILESLVQQAKTGEVVCRLQFLYYYLLNSLVYTRWDYSMFFGDCRMAFDAWALLDRLEVPERIFDARLAMYLPGKVFLDGPNPPTLSQYLDQERDQEWHKKLSPTFPLMDLHPMLHCEIQGYVGPHRTDSNTSNLEYLTCAERRFTELLEIPLFKELLEYVTYPGQNESKQVG
jgi:hypothetical protein